MRAYIHIPENECSNVAKNDIQVIWGIFCLIKVFSFLESFKVFVVVPLLLPYCWHTSFVKSAFSSLECIGTNGIGIPSHFATYLKSHDDFTGDQLRSSILARNAWMNSSICKGYYSELFISVIAIINRIVVVWIKRYIYYGFGCFCKRLIHACIVMTE